MTKTRVRVTSGLLWVLLSLLSFYHPSTAKAEITYGLNAVGYVIDQIPPVQSDSQYPTCGSEWENNINRSFDWEPFAQCPNDQFMVHYSGYITIPQHQTIEFWVAADDGGTISINGTEFGDWNDKGCSWYPSGLMDLPSEQSLSLDGWFYENGGGTCYMLAWNIDGQGWEIVPDSAFTTQAVSTTTTTELPTTTTTTSPPQTVPPTTTVPFTTTTSSSTTTTSTTSTSTTTTLAPMTTTSLPVTTTYPPSQPTTTTEPVPIEVPTTTTSTSTTTSTILARPVPTTTTTSLPPQTTQAPTTSSSTIPPVTTTTIPITESISQEAAIAVATNPDTIKNISASEAKEVFNAITVSDLSSEQADQLVAAVQDAPLEVRQQFENQINVFSGKFNKYVPIGSKINVGQRKVIIAVSGVLFIAPSVPSTSGSSTSKSRSRRK